MNKKILIFLTLALFPFISSAKVVSQATQIKQLQAENQRLKASLNSTLSSYWDLYNWKQQAISQYGTLVDDYNTLRYLYLALSRSNISITPPPTPKSCSSTSWYSDGGLIRNTTLNCY